MIEYSLYVILQVKVLALIYAFYSFYCTRDASRPTSVQSAKPPDNRRLPFYIYLHVASSVYPYTRSTPSAGEARAPDLQVAKNSLLILETFFRLYPFYHTHPRIAMMSGEAWLYLLAVLINAVNLFLQVFFTIMYSDLEWCVPRLHHSRENNQGVSPQFGHKLSEFYKVFKCDS